MALVWILEMTSLEWIYDLGQIDTVSGPVNLWIVGVVVLVFLLIVLEHTSSGRSL